MGHDPFHPSHQRNVWSQKRAKHRYNVTTFSALNKPFFARRIKTPAGHGELVQKVRRKGTARSVRDEAGTGERNTDRFHSRRRRPGTKPSPTTVTQSGKTAMKTDFF